MCNLYQYDMKAEDMRCLMERYDLIGPDSIDFILEQKMLKKVHANYMAPIARMRGADRALEMMRWGFPPPPFVKSNAPTTNLHRIDTGYWKPYLSRDSRCIVPATAFSEFDPVARKQRWFQRPDGMPFFFAGMWRTWTGDRGNKARPNIGDHLLFSFLMTTSNAVVATIQPKAMPVLLFDSGAIEQWLTGTNEDALLLQKPAPNDALELLPLPDAL